MFCIIFLITHMYDNKLYFLQISSMEPTYACKVGCTVVTHGKGPPINEFKGDVTLNFFFKERSPSPSKNSPRKGRHVNKYTVRVQLKDDNERNNSHVETILDSEKSGTHPRIENSGVGSILFQAVTTTDSIYYFVYKTDALREAATSNWRKACACIKGTLE